MQRGFWEPSNDLLFLFPNKTSCDKCPFGGLEGLAPRQPVH